MQLERLVTMLDQEFATQESAVDFAVTEENRSIIHPAFLDRSTLLMLKGSETIERVCTTVFVSDDVIEKVCAANKPALLFTHHQFNYFEDERGLVPITPEQGQRLLDAGISVFVAHAALDTNRDFGISRALADRLHVNIESWFYDYFGAPAAIVGTIKKTDFATYADFVREQLERPALTLHQKRQHVERIALVGGGGDIPDLLQQAADSDCDTLIGGTIEHKWALPFIQEGNKAFHELNEVLGLNLVGGTHYGTERPGMQDVTRYFEKLGLEAEFVEDDTLQQAL